jgi:cobalt-zinc-cadmium efflux system outer membrane protein
MRIQRYALCTLVFFIGLLCVALPSAQAADTSNLSISGGMTLEEALAHASMNRQELAAYRVDLDAAALKLKHAGLPPNPELGIGWDNLGSNLPADDVRETTISLNQPFEVGGKPSARKNKGQSEIMRLQHEQTTAWLDIAAEVRMAFLEVLVARERLTLQQEAGGIASELASLTHERVDAGVLAATEETRAEARKAETGAETHKLKRLLAEAELDLTLTLGKPDTVTVTATGQLPQKVAIPDRQTLLVEIHDSPLLALRRSESELAATGLSLEQANAWSDPALSLAVREIPGKDARAFSVGISIPLPLFQRNQVALAEASATVRKASTNEEAAARRLKTELIKSHTLLVAADQEASTLRNEVLTRAAEALDAVREGFRAGKFRYSDVLEASQSLVTVKTRHLDAIIDLNRAAIALDHLLGKPTIPETSQNFASFSHDRSNP